MIKEVAVLLSQGSKRLLLDKRKAKIIWPSLLAILFLLLITPLLFDNAALKFKIEQKVSEVLKSNFEISGEVAVALIPSPSVTINETYLSNYKPQEKNYNFYAKKIKIKSSFWSFLQGKFSVNEVVFTEAILQESLGDLQKNSVIDNFVEKFIKKPEALPSKSDKSSITSRLFSLSDVDINKFNTTNFPQIIVKNSQIISYDKNLQKKEINNINGNILFSPKKIIANGSFLNEEILNNFELRANFNAKAGKNNSMLNVISSYANFKIIGTFTADNKGFFNSDFKGVVEGEIFDLKNFYKSFIANNGLVFNKINPSSKPIKFSANISDNDGEIIVDEIAISSSVINGKGNFVVDLTSKIPLIDIRLDLESIDMDALWLTDKNLVSIRQEVDIKKDEILSISDFSKEDEKLTVNLSKDFRNFDLTSEIAVRRINYLEEEVKNFNLYLTISKEGELLFLPLSLELPGTGLLRMNGVLEKGEIPKFIGKIDVVGTKLSEVFKWLKIESQNLKYDNLKNYTLYSDIMITPAYVSLNDFYLNINSGETELLGEVYVDYSQKTSSILSNFKITKLDLNNYFLTSGQNVYLSPGSLLKKLLWLNDFSSNNDVTLWFDKLVYDNLVFNDQTIKMRFGQGYLEVNNVKLKAEDSLDLTLSLAFDISGKVPKFDATILSNNFNYRSNLIAQKTDESAAKDAKNLIKTKLTAIDQFFALPSLEGFAGKILVDIEKSYFDGLAISNIKIDGKLKDGIIDYSVFKCDIYGGNLEYSGSMGIKFDKEISGNLNFKNIKLQEFLPNILNISDVDGVANISSGISVVAESRGEFAKNLSLNSKFSAGNVGVFGYGLNDLVRKMFNQKNYVDDLLNPEKILVSSFAKTSFSKAVGEITIDKSRENKFKIDLSAPAVNGIFTGQLDILGNKIDGLANIVFLTGDRKKQIPINIASNVKGSLDDISQSTNLDQVKQYLGLMPRSPIVAEDKSAIALDPKDQSSIIEKSNSQKTNQDAAISQNKVAQQQLDQVDNMSKGAINAVKNAQERQSQQPNLKQPLQ